MELKTKYWDGAYLNNRQKKWFNNFQKQHPRARLKEVYKGLSGDRILNISWEERLPKIIVSGCEDCGRGFIHHRIEVKLRCFGDPRETAKYSYSVSHRSCLLNTRDAAKAINQFINFHEEGQLCLEISPLLVEPSCSNPVIVKFRKKHDRKLKLKYNSTRQMSLVG